MKKYEKPVLSEESIDITDIVCISKKTDTVSGDKTSINDLDWGEWK